MFHRTLRASLLACVLTVVFAATASAADYVPGRVIVKYNAGTSAARGTTNCRWG